MLKSTKSEVRFRPGLDIQILRYLRILQTQGGQHILGYRETARGLVRGSRIEGNEFAIDAETVEALWDFQTGGAVRTNPMSFAIDGKQRVVSTGGQTMFVFGLE